MSVALQAWEAGNPTRARMLLQRQQPKAGEEDLRGFEWRYFSGLFQPREITTLRLTNSEVWASTWSPDCKYVPMGDLGGRIEIWDWIAQKQIRWTMLERRPLIAEKL